MVFLVAVKETGLVARKLEGEVEPVAAATGGGRNDSYFIKPTYIYVHEVEEKLVIEKTNEQFSHTISKL